MGVSLITASGDIGSHQCHSTDSDQGHHQDSQKRATSLDMGRSTFFKISWYTIRSCVISRYSRYSRSEILGLFQLASVATSHVTLLSTKD